jgi:short-subunit dehydrogenase
MTRPLDDQVIVITGASSGIGRETALRLAGKGAKVVVSARREESLDELVEQINSEGGEATSIPADVSDYKEVEALAKGAVTVYGRIDTWVNNAAVLLVAEFENADLDEARRLFNVNFWGEYHGCKAVLPIMKKQGSGTIINVTSVTARRPLPLMSAYSASKAAINALSEALRAELQGSGIELSIIMPASIDTPLYQHARSKEGAMPRPAPPVYPPSEVASAIEKCAVAPKRVVYAGPAGLAFSIGNTLMPDILDKLLGAFGRQVILTEHNLQRPMDQVPATTQGGWRNGRYKVYETAARLALGAGAALFLARRLAKR